MSCRNRSVWRGVVVLCCGVVGACGRIGYEPRQYGDLSAGSGHGGGPVGAAEGDAGGVSEAGRMSAEGAATTAGAGGMGGAEATGGFPWGGTAGAAASTSAVAGVNGGVVTGGTTASAGTGGAAGAAGAGTGGAGTGGAGTGGTGTGGAGTGGVGTGGVGTGGVGTGGVGTGGAAGAPSTGGATGTADCTIVAYGGHDYAFCDSVRSWAQAEVECEAVGMRLARVDDSSEDDWLANTANDIFTVSGRSYMWLGGCDLTVEGDWRWTDGAAFWSGFDDGTPVGGLYTNWATGEPNNLGGVEHCLGGDIAPNPEWIDADCTNYQTRFVCEAY